jgi:choline dehydrogenase
MKTASFPLALVFVGVVALLATSAFADRPANTFPYKSATGYFSPRRGGHLPHSFDFIVIGSGPGGSPVAARLSENPNYNVLLLEKGSDMSNYDTVNAPRHWDITTTSQADRVTMVDIHNEPVVSWTEYEGRVSLGVGLGGTSLINSQVIVRGNANDYDRWATLYNATGWSYNEVLPFFKKLENNPTKYALNPDYHGNSGPLHVSPGSEHYSQDQALVNAAVAAGFPYNPDHNGPQQITSTRGSISYHDLAIDGGMRQSAYQSYILPNLNRPNLWVYDSAFVTKINFDDHNRVVSVSWIDSLNGGVSKTSFVTREVILSSGAIQTPKLLQLSGIGPGAYLDTLGISVVADRPGVGENYQDHVITNLGAAGMSVGWPPADTPDAWNQWLVNKTGPYSSIGGMTVMFLRTKYQDEENDPRPDIEVIGLAPSDAGVFGCVYITNPKSRGQVRITTADPFANPLPTGNYLSDPRDIKHLCEGLRMLASIYNQMSPNPLYYYYAPSNMSDDSVCSYWLTGAQPWTTGHSNTGDHWSGTARMGDRNDPMAVVDSRLRVIGVSGLRVADASIFPEIPVGNTQTPTYMVGEKAAAMILEDNARSH